MNKKISVVIAAYNEETRISEVLKVVEHHPLIDEVIVVNDGSKDKTSEVVKKFDVKLIENEHNMGKTLTVKRGISLAKNDLIMMLDADLMGLESDSITKLAKPVLDGRVEWTLSVRGNSLLIYKLAKMDHVSGERIIPKEFFDDPEIWSKPEIGYGLETLLNKSLIDRKKTFCSVYLPELIVTTKVTKDGFWKGFIGEFKMLYQIRQVMTLHRILEQFFGMVYLNHKYSKAPIKK